MATQIDLNDIYIFHHVAELKSITAASKLLNTSKQTISRKLAQLEDDLSVTLIARNTRNVQLTHAGKDYFKSCSDIIEQVALANARVQQHREAIDGCIKVCLPPEFNNTIMCGYLRQYMEAYPDTKLDINLCDKPQASMADGFDLTIKLGELPDSSLVARKIGTINYGLMASPAYLERQAWLKEGNDLSLHTFIAVTKQSDMNHINDAFITCRKISMNEHMLAKQFAIQGLGFVKLPIFMCLDELSSGDLVVLPTSLPMEERSIHILFAKDKYMPAYVRKFVDYLVALGQTQQRWNVDYSEYILKIQA